MHTNRSTRTLALAVLACLATAAGSGCDTLARSQGKFPVATALGASAIDKGEFFEYPSGTVWRDSAGEPIVKIGYRCPFTGKLINMSRESNESRQSYYMVIDVTNAVKHPRLGAADEETARERLRALADLLLLAADWNGEVYWRHLTTFLEVYGTAKKTSQAALGAAIAGTFISPVLGASLAAGALIIDTGVSDYTGQINVEAYAALRESTSLKRAKLRAEIRDKINSKTAGSLSDVLVLAADYAFSYSIKGALHAVGEQEVQLKNMLITGQSSWQPYFKSEILRHKMQQVDAGLVTGTAATAIRKQWEDHQAELALDQATRTKVNELVRQKTISDAKVAAINAEIAEINAKRALDAARASTGTAGATRTSDSAREPALTGSGAGAAEALPDTTPASAPRH